MNGPRYTLIMGAFYILYPDRPSQGPEPDGDTINFLPDNDDLIWALARFSGARPERRHLGTYGLRFEGIDALETHFLGRHQNLEFANRARDRMLGLMGFGDVEFLPNNPNKIKAAEHHPVRGFVCANGIESNGRVLGLVHPGEPPQQNGPPPDGQGVFVTEDLLDLSVNARLVHEGLAYAELYGTMPIDLADHLKATVADTRVAGKGLWPYESVNMDTAATIGSLADLSELVMFPKLYRRLVSYFLANPGNDLGGFDAWVRADPIRRDDRVILPNRELGNLHDIYALDGNTLQLRVRPEELLFQPDPPH
ncbi:hypothetical protein ACFW9U_28325 [Rhodococcus aetherivorans]|uniref:hypothetical protein n=1 Tax=Rhodococcus aetherivorans TaxID=191292 RepID=UPI00366C112F